MIDEGEIVKQFDSHARRNEKLRERLVANGVPLSEERPIDVHFWASSQRDAAVLARELFKIGYLITRLAPSAAVDNDSADEATTWVVEAGATVAPERALGERFTERMVRLAAAQDAVYGGWGTST